VNNPGDWRSAQQVELLAAPGVVSVSGDGAVDLTETGATIVESALRALVDSRIDEGRALESELRMLNGELASSVSDIQELSSQAEAALEERLREALGKLGKHGSGVVEDKERFGKEVATLLVKSDIAEELTRLLSHIGAFDRQIENDGPRGRALEFLLQEMLRELNTLASKTPLLEIVQLALHGKGIIDRLREQVANVE
jgi:uncharacterized protein (TIGR00255 family)